MLGSKASSRALEDLSHLIQLNNLRPTQQPDGQHAPWAELGEPAAQEPRQRLSYRCPAAAKALRYRFLPQTVTRAECPRANLEHQGLVNAICSA